MGEINCGERDLARAVIIRAIEDADAPRSSLDRREARLFLCAKNKLWENSLKYWCYAAGLEEEKIKKYAREKWMGNGHCLK